jgi:Aerobic-type carbon monoxide dehydrogenase, large subunit CoxL/CutL homologs
MSAVRLSRRSFLKVSATAAGGLMIAVYTPARGASHSTSETFAPSGFIRIEPDNRITLWAKCPDMGQGVKTALPMLVAEELEADWSRVHIEQADLNTKLFGGQGSGGSDNIPSEWDTLRRAGAAAREMLIAAAAQAWRVAASECMARNSEVIHPPSGKRLTYGELARTAAEQPVPKEPPLKDPKDYRLVGTRVRGVDNQAIITGKPLFGLDAKVPGMLYAVIQKSPVFGGKVASIDDRRARAVAGVRHVVEIKGLDNPTHLRTGVAVVADSTWAAMKGREALVVNWDDAPQRGESSENLKRQFQGLAARPGKALRQAGDVDKALNEAAHALEAVYEFPFLAHATMEPMNCVASVREGRCEIWGPLQMPMFAQQVVAAATGLPREAITIHVTRIGGGFGRRLLSDYVAEAAYISKAINAPVQVAWSREDDLTQDYYRPASLHRLRGGVDTGGRLTAWSHHLINVSRNTYRKGTTPPESTEVYGLLAPRSDNADKEYELDLMPTLIPNLRLEYSEAPTSIPTGAWRAPAHNVNAFAIECFLDELAHACGKDAIEFRLQFLGDAKDFPYQGDNPTPYNPTRLKGVLQLAAQKAGWGRALPSGWSRGIAAHFTFGSYAAIVADVSVASPNRIKIQRILAAIDVGTPINLSGLEAQTQGGIIDGLSAAMWGDATVEQGRATRRNFDSYRLLRNREAPPIEVHIVPSNVRPTGYGEIALPPVAPAIANAIFQATGKRIRRLPFSAGGWQLA